MNDNRQTEANLDQIVIIKFVFIFFSQASGMTPLMYAVKDNRTSYLDRLIDLGSDVGARNNVSFQPFDVRTVELANFGEFFTQIDQT